MEPSLCFIDRRDGTLIGKLALAADLHQLSIRHMAVDMRNRVWFGCQFRGPEGRPQLVGYATLDGDIRLVELPDDSLRNLRNYVGSVARSAGGDLIAVSSPEGDTILAIDAATTRPVFTAPLKEGCGIAPAGAGFLASSGLGDVTGLGGSPASPQKFDFGFDNHLRRLEL
jgi:hypothetical protein